MGGLLYLAIIVLGAFAETFVANKLVASGDTAAMAHNILVLPRLWRLSVAGDLIIVLCAVPFLWIEYLLLRLLWTLCTIGGRPDQKRRTIQPTPKTGGDDQSGALVSATQFERTTRYSFCYWILIRDPDDVRRSMESIERQS
jgi:hypothetical protein